MWPALPAVIGAAGSLLGSIAGGVFGNKNTKDINAANLEQTRLTNQSNQLINQRSLEFQQGIQAAQNRFNSIEAQKAFDREAAYNSPVHQMQMLRDAGINPFSVFGQNGSVASVHSSPASGSALGVPSQIPMQSARFDYNNSGLAASLQMVDAVTKVIDSISSAGLKGSQKKQIDSLIDDTVKKLRAETENQEALAQINKLELSFKETFGMLEADARYNKLVAEASDLWQSVALKISQGELIDEQKLTEQSKRMLNDIEGQLKGEQKRLFKLQADNYYTVLAQNIKESNSRIESNLASAAESRASAATQNEIRPYVSRINAANARIYENDAAFKDETFVADVERTMDSLQQMGIVTQSMLNQLKLAIKENNWYEARQIIGLACDISNSASQWMPKVNISRESRSGSDDIRGNYYEEKSTRSKSRVGR